MKRKIIQIQLCSESATCLPHIAALCDDGSVWTHTYGAYGVDGWQRIDTTSVEVSE